MITALLVMSERVTDWHLTLSLFACVPFFCAANLFCDPMFKSANEANQVRQVHLNLLNIYLNLETSKESLMLPFESIGKPRRK